MKNHRPSAKRAMNFLLQAEQSIAEPPARSHSEPLMNKTEPVALGNSLILTEYFKKFKRALSDSDLETLLEGNDDFIGFRHHARLLMAISYLKVKYPNAIENPVGLLSAFLKEPARYLSDSDYDAWKRQALAMWKSCE